MAAVGGADNPFDADLSTPGESTWNPVVLPDTPPRAHRQDMNISRGRGPSFITGRAPPPEPVVALRAQHERDNRRQERLGIVVVPPTLPSLEETDEAMRRVRVQLHAAEGSILEARCMVNAMARDDPASKEVTKAQRIDLSNLRAAVHGLRSLVDLAMERSRLAASRLRVPVVHSLTLHAARVRLEPPVSREGLYLTAARPPDIVAIAPHHVCTICACVKSHPVSYKCGHSHCFVCIRMWLERNWRCPLCMKVMYEPPFRQYAEEDALTAAYPLWGDKSMVNYSWKGLKFAVDPDRQA
ncbi:hypothetical protein B0H15DRAFT_954374 [Mycena belliarum]|uniref:RING-type domain-containing protein n=1 Tax=Mycena belliarum TaxID=1033014 RepID=A0AAD6XLL2_9AGAR|nr:hypothetical protein B0H15DRAFT_954374 [Mycena belliae]